MGSTTQTRSCCTELGSPGESPCCLMIALLMLEPCLASMGAVQRSGRRNATDTHVLHGYPRPRCVRSRDRAIHPARGLPPNCTGGAVALAFACEGADVIINYLGSEEVAADETIRLIESAVGEAFGHHLLRTAS
jgi:hypothetical protein